MEPLLDLPIDQFFGALNELGLDPERRADLLREYRRRNSAFSPVYGLLDSVADEDAAAGMQRADIVPISRPEGMSVFEAIRSGDWRLAVPQGALDAVGNVAGALDVPAAAAAGLIPREDMVSEALNAAGTVMGLGGLLARPAGSFGMGGRVADSAAETPAQQVARLLREDPSQVTDDMLDALTPNDNVELARLYDEGATGMPMPMDEASRMARADQWWPEQGYHSTGADFPSFEGPNQRTSHGTHIGTADAANQRLAGRWNDRQRERMEARGDYVPDNILPLRYAQENPIPMEDMIHWAPEDLTGRLEYLSAVGEIGPYNVQPRVGAFGSEYFDNRDIVGSLEGSGYTGFRYENVVEDPGSISDAVFAPRNIRSRFARFDPRLRHLANLNAANIDPLTGAAAMGASQQQQDPLASLRAYLAQNGLLSQ